MQYRKPHSAKRMMAPWGSRIRIDCGIAKLIRLLWKLGIGTCFSCEDHNGEVEIGVPRVEIAAWCWSFSHADENPTYEQLKGYRRQLEEFQHELREQAATQTLAWYRQNIADVQREIQDDPAAWRQEILETLQQELLEYEREGTAWKSLRGHGIAIPARELRISSHWRWTIHPRLIYCKFPCDRLARVEANLEAVLRWKRAGGRICE